MLVVIGHTAVIFCLCVTGNISSMTVCDNTQHLIIMTVHAVGVVHIMQKHNFFYAAGGAYGIGEVLILHTADHSAVRSQRIYRYVAFCNRVEPEIIGRHIDGQGTTSFDNAQCLRFV